MAFDFKVLLKHQTVVVVHLIQLVGVEMELHSSVLEFSIASQSYYETVDVQTFSDPEHLPL